MVKTNDLSKVLKALETVLNDCLSVNRDDTLIEKFITFLRHELDLNFEEKQSVLKCLEKSIDLSLNELMANNDCNDWTLIAIKLRISGSLLADRDLFVSQQNCLKFVQIIANEVINCNKSSLKFSFFRLLNDISVHHLALNWMLSTSVSNSSNLKTFPQILWYFLNKTETRFVEREVLKLFVCLLNHSLSQTDLSSDFDAIVSQLISSANPSNIEIIRELIVLIEPKRDFISKYKVIDGLVDCIEVWNQKFSEKLFILSQILGLCVDNNEKAIEITDKFISLNDLKSLIGFLTAFIQNPTNCAKSLSQMWFNYTIGWFAIKSRQTHCFDIAITDRIFSERLSDNSLNDYCLRQIIKLDFNCFEDKQIRLVFEVISKFIDSNKENREMRKTLLQSFCVLENMSLSPNLKLESIEYFLEVYSDLLGFLSNDFKLIVLKSLRVFITNKVWPKHCDSGNNALIKLIQQMSKILIENDVNENDWELSDSALEVIYVLFSSLNKNHIKPTIICPQLISTVLSIKIEDNVCSTMRSTLMSVLLLIYLNASKQDLNELCVVSTDYKDLESLSALLLTDDLIVRINLIKTFEENVDSLIDIERQNKHLFGEIIKIVCKLSINDLDEELQTNALKLLKNLFEKLSQQKQLSEVIDLFLNSHYFHVIFQLIHNSEYLFKVRQISAQTIEYFQNKLNSLADIEIQSLEPIITRDLAVDSNHDSKLTPIICIETKVIFDYIKNFNVNTFQENESEDRPKLNVLDDILSVSLIDTNILIDCY